MQTPVHFIVVQGYSKVKLQTARLLQENSVCRDFGWPGLLEITLIYNIWYLLI